MALLDDVKSELAAFEGDSPAAIKAQAAAMIRFGGGLRPVQNTYVIQAVFTSLDVAEWLKNTLRNTFGHEAEVNHLTRQTPNGPVETYVVLVTRNVVALALQTGLVDRRKQQVRGLPSEVVNGSIAQIKAAWRGAFMARGVHGQSIYIDPKAQMVVVRYASHPIAGNAGIDPTSLPMYQALADALTTR